MDTKILESEIADHLLRVLHSPRSRDIHAAVCGQAVRVGPTLAEVRSALQRMQKRGEVRAAGHFGWRLTDSERERRRRAESEAWNHFDRRAGAGG